MYNSMLGKAQQQYVSKHSPIVYKQWTNNVIHVYMFGNVAIESRPVARVDLKFVNASKDQHKSNYS